MALDSVLQKQYDIKLFIPNKKLADFPEQYKVNPKLEMTFELTIKV